MTKQQNASREAMLIIDRAQRVLDAAERLEVLFQARYSVNPRSKIYLDECAELVNAVAAYRSAKAGCP